MKYKHKHHKTKYKKKMELSEIENAVEEVCSNSKYFFSIFSRPTSFLQKGSGKG